MNMKTSRRMKTEMRRRTSLTESLKRTHLSIKNGKIEQLLLESTCLSAEDSLAPTLSDGGTLHAETTLLSNDTAVTREPEHAEVRSKLVIKDDDALPGTDARERPSSLELLRRGRSQQLQTNNSSDDAPAAAPRPVTAAAARRIHGRASMYLMSRR